MEILATLRGREVAEENASEYVRLPKHIAGVLKTIAASGGGVIMATPQPGETPAGASGEGGFAF
eukprot:3641228-Pyramimonas_sp.AAC.1